ncbi:MFS transporter, partial [Streptomyces sp. SID10244]|nr:MFS transporter [Streptomyces sp. SID10244]
WMFALSIIPALISLLIRAKVEESEAWRATRERVKQTQTSVRDLLANPVIWRRFIFLVLLMTAFNWMSHGTQDIYPTFLKATEHGGAELAKSTATWIAVIYNVGAIIGGLIAGALSERFGRKVLIVACALLALPIVPL